MSESTPTKYLFAVFAPDYTDSEGLTRRLAVRTKHLENAKGLFATGVLKIGGALVSPETYDKAEKKLVGSMMVCEAENLDIVRNIIESDIYYTTGVWDKEKLVILPWLSASPLPQTVAE
ncbi:hypothetical protein EW026_g2832 [Hermanssonia centrifuga]|uniref:Uncharacterized protein n=2 Tax=Hermanssonia centrifuga TaxID=98765 RepID=A0A2R6NVZ0_9APHY|nr:hypothetical protein PHLCEN_2v7641 [Hermanssonia centrifuga]THG99530.1 hypothetical protein EW026_g2832 [Hermanssonia centrifuga]